MKTAIPGAQTLADITGKKIKIKVGEHRGKAVLRIDPQPVKDGASPGQ